MHRSPAISSDFLTMSVGASSVCSQQRARRGLRVGAARADRDDAVLGLEHVAVAGDDQRGLAVGDREHRLEPAQHAVGAPVLGELDRRAHQVALVLLELGLEALEQREGVGGARRRSRRGSGRGSSWRTLRAVALTTMLPSVTWPSPPSATHVAAAHAEDGRAVIGVHREEIVARRAAVKRGAPASRPTGSDRPDLDVGVLVDAHRAEEQRDHPVRVDEAARCGSRCAAPAPS